MGPYFIFIVIFSSFNVIVSADDGVCEVPTIVTEWVTVPEYVTYLEKYKEKCYGVFKCKKTRIRSHVVNRRHREEKKLTRTACCAGYIKNEEMTLITGILKCDPICFPRCDPATAYCELPYQCRCHENYIPISTTHCQPNCSSGCPNGVCVGPENCSCNAGYELVDDKCSPHCDETCVNATCTAPDICECQVGYRNAPGSSTVCTPYCSSGCQNGVCIDPEECQCGGGYEKIDNMCIAICSGGCGNGTCERPGHCDCIQGHRHDEEGRCHPHCDHCDNGECVAPNICNCLPGYTMTNGSCNPVCYPLCFNATCKSPNICECDKGYKKTNDTCKPVCQDCINGYCNAPNECKCNDGYVKLYDNNTCVELICDNCKNGECESPGNCVCHEGYVGDGCHPFCSSCVNAVCVAPEQCECLPGFIEGLNKTCSHTTETPTTSIVSDELDVSSTSIQLDSTSEEYELSTAEIYFTESGAKAVVAGNENTNFWIYVIVGISLACLVFAAAFILFIKWRKSSDGSYMVKEDSDDISVVFSGPQRSDIIPTTADLLSF